MIKRFTSWFSGFVDFSKLFMEFLQFFGQYSRRHVMAWSFGFEKQKNVAVKFFMMKRGRYNRPFLHIIAMIVLGIGVVLAPFLADTYPVFSKDQGVLGDAEASTGEESITVDDNVFKTEQSEKPRDKTISYTVKGGDTLASIAQTFGISVETIKWANNLSGDSISPGDEIKILPVTGIAHKVQKGDTVYTIAKKYGTDAQAIVDFPFNDFANPETFALAEGQMLVVPEGVMPTMNQPVIRRQTYIASGPITISPSGFTWPMRGGISQFYTWYHQGIDITDPIGTPIVAAHNGRVTSVLVGTYDGGYGTNVRIEDANGVQSHYAHMSGVNVSMGQDVVGGKTVVGWVGMTGRTTGPHLHFEVLKNGALQNPMSYLQ